MAKIKVGVAGYGTIGQRLADGVAMQGDMELEVKLLESAEKAIKAPDLGSMVRNIHESLSCRASYCFKRKGAVFFEFETCKASFEYEYDR